MDRVRGTIMVLVTYSVLLVMGAVALPTAIVSSRGALWWCKTYSRTIFAAMRLICGIRVEFRGPIPTHPCIVAVNHQSFLDVLLLVVALPYPRFVMKRSLLWVPVLGYFARRIGCIAIDREKAGASADILDSIGSDRASQMVIYPQGTRTDPGVMRPFRSGVVAMKRGTGLPVELAATNAGWVWPGHGVRRSAGTAVMSFLGSEGTETLSAIQNRIETETRALALEARDVIGPIYAID